MNTRHFFKSLVLLPALLLSGCDNTWIAERIGDTALGAIAVGSYEFLTNKPCRDGARRVYVSEVDQYGIVRNNSQEMHVDCDQPGVYGSRTDAARVAEAYQLTERTSYLLLKLFKDAKGGNAGAFFEVGLSQMDIENIAVYELPTDHGLSVLASKWHTDVKILKRVFKKIYKDARKLDKMQARAEARDQD